jgi:predicted site-specific integrase-resolvase
MMLSLQQAADLARINKSTLFRAVKAGKVSASRDEHGQWRLDPAELSRVYPIAIEAAEQQHAIPRKRDRTDELVALLNMAQCV